jgi:hypothetical protein
MASGPGDDEQDRTGADGGERTTGAGGVSVVTEDDGEDSSLGDGMSLDDGNADLWGLDVVAAFADTNPEYAISPASTKPLEEVGTTTKPPTTFMATDWQRWVARRGLLRNGRWNGKQYELERGQVYVYIGTLRLLRQDTP